MQIDTGVLSILIAIISFFSGQFSGAKKSGKEDGEMKANIRYIKESAEKQERKLDAVAGNYDAIKVEMEELKGRMSALEQKVKMLHGGS